MNRFGVLSFVAACMILASAVIVSDRPKAGAQSATGLDAFQPLVEIRFDESTDSPRPTPHLPKAWHFIGISNGEKENSNNLWFKDDSGDVYMMQGFTTGSKFILSPVINHLGSK